MRYCCEDFIGGDAEHAGMTLKLAFDETASRAVNVIAIKHGVSLAQGKPSAKVRVHAAEGNHARNAQRAGQVHRSAIDTDGQTARLE